MERFLNSWNAWIVASSWQLALVIALIAVTAKLTRRWSARYRHILWALVLVRVFLPPTLSAPWSVGDFRFSGSLDQPSPTVAAAMDPVAALANASAVSPVANINNDVSPIQNQVLAPSRQLHASNPAPTLSHSFRRNAVPITFSFWLTGAAIYLLTVSIPYFRLKRKLRASQVIDEGPLAVTLERLRERLHLAHAPRLLLSQDVTSPFLMGIFRPTIVLPAGIVNDLTSPEIENVLLHELAHHKRRDIYIGWAQVAAQALFWFHPLVWFANGQIREERERACDELVVAGGHATPRSYAESLLNVLLAARGRSSALPGFLGIFERSTRLQRRLEEIMKTNNPHRRFGTRGWIFIALFALVVMPIAGPRQIAAEETTGTAAVSAAAASSQPNDSLLNETQQLWLKWTIGQFGPDPDPSRYASEDTAERKEKEERFLTILEGPEGAEVNSAISGLAALRSKAAVKPLLRIAMEQREKNNRSRWMSVRALGLIGDKSVVPELIHLIYHGNQNTRLWAQISLVRLTGQNFGYDWQKWGEWWSARGEAPPFKSARIEWIFKEEDRAYGDQEKQKEVDREFVKKTQERARAEIERKAGEQQAGQASAFREKAEELKKHAHALREAASKQNAEAEKLRAAQEELRKKSHELMQAQREALRNDPQNREAQEALREMEEALKELEQSSDAKSRGDSQSVQNRDAPQIINTFPVVGTTDVDPAIKAITVTFDRDMRDGMSWTGGGPEFPPHAEGESAKAHWLDKRTCVLPVALKAGAYYRVGINSTSYQNFCSADGIAARPSAIFFTTVGASDELIARVQPPKIVSIEPANGAIDVDPSITEIRITFNVPMGPGYSFVQTGNHYPDTTTDKTPFWSEDKRTITRPVQLRPGTNYQIGPNGPSHINFQSEAGVPLEPAQYRFKTR